MKSASLHHCRLLASGLLLLCGCTMPKPSITPVTRADILATAEAYRTHRWQAIQANVRHGLDRQGIRVDTPDIGFKHADGARAGWWVPGQWNMGVPYQWGGFDSLAEFDQNVARGFAAGDIYTLTKRAGLEAAVSREACGIDCSGFISRCWQLKRSVSTRELPSLCERLHGYEDLRPGDILNTHNSHVLLFAAWANQAHTKLLVYEAGSQPEWKVLRRTVTVAALQKKEYECLRYRGIRD